MTVVATMKRARENRLRRTADGQGNVARRDKTQAAPSASDCWDIAPHGARASCALTCGLMGGRTMIVGTVQWFDVRKGYGFLKPDDGGVDVLVSICALERAGMANLDQGQRLSFEVVQDPRIGRSCAENLSASGLQAHH